MVSTSPKWNFPNTEICLPFAQTDWFARVNGKQPKSPQCVSHAYESQGAGYTVGIGVEVCHAVFNLGRIFVSLTR